MLTPTWQAILEDGSLIEQGDIPQMELFTGKYKLRAFRLLDKKLDRVFIVVMLDRNKRLVFRSRPENKVNVGDTGRTVYLVGWQQTLPNFRDAAGNPCNVQSISTLYWNGTIVVRDGFFGEAAYPFEPLQPELDAGMFDPRTVKGSTERAVHVREPDPED
jgi:hypothetical protein